MIEKDFKLLKAVVVFIEPDVVLVIDTYKLLYTSTLYIPRSFNTKQEEKYELTVLTWKIGREIFTQMHSTTHFVFVISERSRCTHVTESVGVVGMRP